MKGSEARYVLVDEVSDPVTPAMIQAVREHECRFNGHTYAQIHSGIKDGPERIICTNCGASWPVGDRDIHVGRAQ